MTPHYQRALLLYQQSRPDLAEQELRQALAAEPDDAAAHALLALCLCDRKDFAAATYEAEEAVRLEPAASFSHYALAYALYRRDFLRQAETVVGQALALDPGDVDSYSLLAAIRFEQRRWADALQAAEQGLALDAEHPGCANFRAMALVKLGRRAEAGATIGEALRRDPENALTHANQGWALLEQGQPHKALEHFREALRLEPNLEWARRGIVEALKARNIFYRLMLRYFLWTGRLSSRAQWGVLLGLFFAQQVLASDVLPPALKPAGRVLLWCLVGFALLTWVADPLFNLLLRLDRLGRLALSNEQTRAANAVGGCLLLAAAALVCWAVSRDLRFALAALVSGGLILPVAATFKSRAGRPRLLMALYTAGVAALGAGGVAIFFFGQYLPPNAWDDLLAAAQLMLGAFLFGVIGSTWLFNLLVLARPRR